MVSLDIASRIDKWHKQSGCSVFNEERCVKQTDFPKTSPRPERDQVWVARHLTCSIETGIADKASQAMLIDWKRWAGHASYRRQACHGSATARLSPSGRKRVAAFLGSAHTSLVVFVIRSQRCILLLLVLSIRGGGIVFWNTTVEVQCYKCSMSPKDKITM